ncbi:glycoside hydrolase family 127 protein [Streptomyces aquilus]|uniref:Glycoside hydrolase family 127 protein n=1 Tax=Streptomyces aquilus TaxID=2548456 RepID=A0A3Q9C146_9ACTN|nr:beta-L-arabinofuranosidase domain-containing protein [Streptomyces aquilus]AZP21132.1 glycoside hydrolase family 127 protein [Streptomyces aquilus]
MPIGPIRLTDRASSALRPATAARVTGGFWAERRRTNAEVSIPQGPARLESAGNLANLRAAAVGKGTFTGDFPFQDSDVHKWLEAASWQLADAPGDTELAAQVAELTGLLAAAQQADGYLQTYYQLAHPEKRWQELGWGHELYCAGHLIQAAVAHHRATGRRELLDVAERFAVLVDSVFGADKEIDGVCGHPEVETALVELYRETGERRWLELAGYFVDRRGHGLLDADVNPHLGKAYWQDHTPVRAATSVTGHAVRQLYLLAAVTDLAAETGDGELRATAERLWDAMVSSKTYLTGGLGARHEGEAFGEPYELPPDRAYAETCAAIASIQWSWRMALLTGEAKYSDLVERTLYNGFLAGVGLDGDSWLYVNPLQVREEYEGAFEPDKTARRTPWFRCACCPPNVMRLLASLPHYLASGTTGDAAGLQLHQYATGVYEAGGGRVRVETAYPWQGRIAVTIEEAPADADWTLSLRIPAWCTDFTASAPDGAAPAETHPGWLRLRRRWSPGDTLTLDLELDTRLTRPDPYVDAVRGCVAIERGPLVHCLEAVDQPPGVRFEDLTLPDDARLAAHHDPGLLGGVTVVTADGRSRGGEDVVPLTAVPYYAWANRRPGAMRVWIPRE